MDRYFPKEKIRITGNPVRSDLKELSGKREEALQFFGLKMDAPVLLVIGGSLGARTINRAMLAGSNRLKEAGVQVIWQTGKSGYEAARAATTDSIRVFDFIQRMDLAYAAADLVVSRSGASSVSELALAQKACILVPSPNVAEDHQTKNAQALVSQDAAVLVSDRAADSELVTEALKLMSHDSERERLSKAIGRFALPAAAEDIANEIYQLSGK